MLHRVCRQTRMPVVRYPAAKARTSQRQAVTVNQQTYIYIYYICTIIVIYYNIIEYHMILYEDACLASWFDDPVIAPQEALHMTLTVEM